MRTATLLVLTVLLAGGLAGCFGGTKSHSESIPPASETPTPIPEPPTNESTLTGGFSNTSFFPGDYKAKGPYGLTLQAGPFKIGPEKLETLASKKGGPIQVGYVVPEVPNGTRVPVIVTSSVYFGTLKPGTFRTSHTSNPKQIVDFLLDNYVPHGYAVALVPARGAAGNGGCYEWWSADERADLNQALDWLANAPWSDGNLGLIGLSQAGAATWQAAGSGNPHVKTIVPMASETDLYTWFVRNGTPAIVAQPLGTPAFWFLYSVFPYSVDKNYQPTRDPSRIPDGLQCPSTAYALAASLYTTGTGATDPVAYAAARDLRPDVEKNYRGSIFLVHGFQDWLAYPHLVHPWVQSLEDRGIVVKMWLGQWRHRMPDDPAGGPFFQPTRRIDFAETLLHWFDYWLKANTTVDLGPRVQVADSKNQWRNENDWPPRDADANVSYLLADNTLAGKPGAEGQKPLFSDPRRTLLGSNSSTGDPTIECPGCAFFKGPVLTQSVRLAGLPDLQLTVTPAGPGGVVSAYLYLHTGSTYQRIGWSIMDLRYAHRGNTPGAVTPGVSLVLPMQMEPVDAVAPAGSNLVLEIGQAGYGESGDVFVNTQSLASLAYYRSLPSNPVLLQLGGEKSILRLPTISRDANATFEPPKP